MVGSGTAQLVEGLPCPQVALTRPSLVPALLSHFATVLEQLLKPELPLHSRTAPTLPPRCPRGSDKQTRVCHMTTGYRLQI